LDHVPFLYGEELMVAETTRRLQLDILYDPRFRIMHVEHSTTGKSASARLHQAAAASYCADTYFPLMNGHTKGTAHE
jgi:hypothetical protein